jgi:NitT/TauT family transport system ATP-binding protein
MTAQAAIDVREVSKDFQQEDGAILRVLDRFSLTVGCNDIICVFGPNGCGKTTLLNICGGIEYPDSGDATVFQGAASEVQIGYVPQSYGESLFPWMTLQDNVAFPLRVRGEAKQESRARAAQMLHAFMATLVLTQYPYHSCPAIS